MYFLFNFYMLLFNLLILEKYRNSNAVYGKGEFNLLKPSGNFTYDQV
jgi:hypothetical protein